MGKAYKRFELIMNRCEKLMSDDYCVNKNEDILRSSIIFAVVAMERYLKERFMESFVPVCRPDGFSNSS